MTGPGPGGEMPFLDHLEELRMRILRSLGAVVLGFAAGVWIVQQFDFVSIMKAPIAPYLPDGRLTFTSPTEPLMITLKLGFVLGLVLASPVIIWQVWAFLSPALYDRERKLVVPALVAGMLLFLTGAALGWIFVVPQALRVFFGFQAEALQPMITYDNWFGFVMQIVLALGLSFELPLVIIILAALGVATPQGLHRFRRFAVVGSFIAGAILSPGADVFSMLMMTVPLLLLYEVGFAGTVLIHKRRMREALKAAPSVVLLLAALGLATPARAQEPVQRPPAGQPAPGQPGVPAPGDTTRGPPRRPGQPMDSVLAERLGLPTAPSQQFQPPDSAYSALVGRPGYVVTKFRGDSAALFIEQGRLELRGNAMTDRQDAVMEAETITYEEGECALEAEGDPKLFSEGQVLVGEGLRYDTCRRRGVVTQALTKFEETGTTWFIRGNVAKDSIDTRMFAGRSELTSCDLPTPHYHFAARRIKWISKDVLVARPVILYIRDVPILWLPFIFQDLRPGRHSGILIPQFGLNDIVRTNAGYRRQIANIGYYWATNDYMDVTFRFDWFSGRYIQYGAQMNYRVLNRFLNGSLAVDRTDQLDGGNNLSIRWDHQQRFSLRSSIALSLNYVSNSQVVNNNAIDPILNTQNVNSSLRYEKRFTWGNVNLGANARQNLSDDSYSLQLPALTVSPKPIALGRNSTWSPGFSVTNDIQGNQRRGGPILVAQPDGSIDSLENTATTRTLTASLQTPVRLGNFNWANDVRYVDRNVSGRDSLVVVDSLTGNPSVTYFSGNYQSEFDWNTGVNLPILFRGTWKLQPTLGITNTTAGPFALRNRNTGGDWVVQGKRAQFSLSATPTFFAFFGGGLFGVQRIRHSINPLINWAIAPSASVPEEYARAIAAPGQALQLESRPQNIITLSLQQNFEAKARPAPEDTLGTQARKFRLLSIQTSAFAYDFERAKDSGATGWVTQTIQNNLLSDLLPGFNLALGINLWRGVAGTDTATFKPFVQTVNANFSLTSRTFQSILGGLGLGAGRSGPQGQPSELERAPNFQTELQRRPIRPGSFNTPNQSMLTGRRGFTSSFSYTLQRIRQDGLPPGAPRQPDRQNLQFSMAFSPTAFWAASFTGQYNLTDSQFESIRVQLERDLHEWRAAFSFTRNANGNVAFFFSVFLSDLPDLRWDYQQTTFEQ